MGAVVNAEAEANKQARVTTATDFIFLRFLVVYEILEELGLDEALGRALRHLGS